MCRLKSMLYVVATHLPGARSMRTFFLEFSGPSRHSCNEKMNYQASDAFLDVRRTSPEQVTQNGSYEADSK